MSATKAAKARTRATRAARREAARRRASEQRRAQPAPAAHAHDAFPVTSYEEAVKHLRRPFTPEAVKFKVQSTWPKDAPTGALVVAYIDARLVSERLNLVCPHAWSQQYVRDGQLLWCHLTVFGITRPDIGDGYQGKGLVSDALKRAAVQFGVGVSLYATPTLRFYKNAEELVKDKRTAKGPSLELTPAGQSRCRELYRAWLDVHGTQAFGDVLDHGDVEGAIGDTEAEATDLAEAPARETRPTVATPSPPSNLPDRSSAPLPEPELTDADHEKAVEQYLAINDALADLRAYANDGMKALGTGPKQRHQYLANHTTKAQLEELKARLDRAANTSATD